MPKVESKPDFPQAAARHMAWWDGSSIGGRPAVSVFHIPKPGVPAAQPDPRPRAQQEADPAFFVNGFERSLKAFEYPAETMPAVWVLYADNVCLAPALAGAELEYRPDTTWVKPRPEIYEIPTPAFDPRHPVFTRLLSIQNALIQRFADTGVLSPPVLMDGMTALSLFRDSGPLCLDLLDRPADVQRVAKALDQLSLDAHAAFFEPLRKAGHDQTVTWAGIYSQGKAEMVQCDFGVMLSPAMFDEFAMPGLRLVTEYMDHSCYHLDGTCQCRFLDLLASLPRLHAIQWNPEPGAAPVTEWLGFFKDVRRKKLSLWAVCSTPAEAVYLTRHLGPDGLMLVVKGVKTLPEVDRLLEELTQAGARFTGL